MITVDDWIGEIEHALWGKRDNTFERNQLDRLRLVVERILAAADGAGSAPPPDVVLLIDRLRNRAAFERPEHLDHPDPPEYTWREIRELADLLDEAANALETRSQTSHQGIEHLYCSCPCHRKDLKPSAKRKMWFQMKQELAKSERKQRVPKIVRGANGVHRPSRIGKKTFRFVKALDPLPAGIMQVVHEAVKKLKEGTVADITVQTEAGIRKVLKQDPTTQTSIMLHRLLKAGCVEIV